MTRCSGQTKQTAFCRTRMKVVRRLFSFLHADSMPQSSHRSRAAAETFVLCAYNQREHKGASASAAALGDNQASYCF
ncbi:hypothetical protein HDV64DRAFT_254568 [Trichoderma sp. TUCIM 5745]